MPVSVSEMQPYSHIAMRPTYAVSLSVSSLARSFAFSSHDLELDAYNARSNVRMRLERKRRSLSTRHLYKQTEVSL